MPYLNAGGVRLAYRRSGEGEPILLIMGSGASGLTLFGVSNCLLGSHRSPFSPR